MSDNSETQINFGAIECDARVIIEGRRMLGYSRATAALRAGVSVSVVERIERGVPVYAESVEAVANALNLALGTITRNSIPTPSVIMTADRFPKKTSLLRFTLFSMKRIGGILGLGRSLVRLNPVPWR
jgi:transcriptional regulator with XRE-family HTH domain